MTSAEIEGYARAARKRLNKVFEEGSPYARYKDFGPVPALVSVADDLCELVIALAQNQTDAIKKELDNGER